MVRAHHSSVGILQSNFVQWNSMEKNNKNYFCNIPFIYLFITIIHIKPGKQYF